jgi:hypothetical protein
MSIHRAGFVFAGCVILASLALTLLVSPWFMLLTAFAGVTMIQAAFTGFRPAAMVFKALGFPAGAAFR